MTFKTAQRTIDTQRSASQVAYSLPPYPQLDLATRQGPVFWDAAPRDSFSMISPGSTVLLGSEAKRCAAGDRV
jgi:hypothetical protein